MFIRAMCLVMSDCDPINCSLPGSSVHEISRQYWSGMPFPIPGNLPYPEIKPVSPTSSASPSISDLPKH